MVLIVGGRSQGKLAFARSLFPEYKELDFGDGRVESPDELLNFPCLCHFETLVQKLLKAGQEPAAWLEDYLGQHPDAVIISDEIGSGIIPMDPFEEEWREAAGRALCDLAGRSAAFYRVICGCGQRIK